MVNVYDRGDVHLISKTVKGIGWVSLSQVINQAVQFIVTAVLARVLFPEDFGLVAMIAVFSNFLAVFQGLGMSTAIIQKKDLEEKQLSSIFWITLGIGLFLSLLMISLSPLIAVFYKQPELMNLSKVLGTIFFISSIGSIPNALLSKKMQFKKAALVEISVTFISGIAGILLALIGFGVWSLVYKSVIGAVLSSFLLFIVTKWKPAFSFNWHKIKDMFSFGANLTGFGVLNYFNRNLDNLLIGKFLGPISLGYYNFSYSILFFPVFQISGALGRVFFPALCSIQEDLPRVRNIYTQATFYISVITFPLMIGIFALAPEFVRAIFGPKWIPAIAVLRILVLVGMIQSIITTQGWVYGVTGKTDIMLKWEIFSFIVVAIGFVIGLRYGIVGVASAYAITCFLLIIPSFYISFRLIKLNIWKFFGNFKSTFFISIIMGIIVAMVRHILKTVNFMDCWILIICTVLGIIIYIGLMLVFKKQVFNELIRYIRTGLSK